MADAIPRRYLVCLWLLAGGLAFVLCVPFQLSGTLVGGVFVPGDHDSFYHARRIIDAIDAPLSMYQFDAKIHAPEGSWITWPWAYDMTAAIAAKALMAVSGSTQPMSILAFFAPAWLFVNAALLLGVAAQLRLSFGTRILALLFFALSPLTNDVHRVGMIDHHYVEYTFVLATLWLGLRWFRDLSDRRRALALGALLGAALAFHNSLFVTQAPVLAALAWRWALRRPLAPDAAAAFAAVLVGATALFLLPSQPFRDGVFSFYLHSWFHLYVSCCTAAFCVAFSRVPATPRNAAWLAAAALILTVPLLAQMAQGSAWVFGRIEYLSTIPELNSLARIILNEGAVSLVPKYSLLLWLLPLTIGWLCWRLRREAGDASLFFVVMTLFGTFLMLQQFRLHYFGSFALTLPLCLLIEDLRRAPPGTLARRAAPFALAAAALAMLPMLPMLARIMPPAFDFQYALTRQIYPSLHAACAKHPGVVLADHADGHYIRYHSDCSVIGNMFIITPQHVRKVRDTEELLALGSVEEVLARAPYVRYVLVRRADNVLDDAEPCGVDCPENRGLRFELLSKGPPYPAKLELLEELRVRKGAQVQPLARLFLVRTSLVSQ
jgi:hypothetical protein